MSTATVSRTLRFSAGHEPVTPQAVLWSRRAWSSDLGLTALLGLTFAILFVLGPLTNQFPAVTWALLAADVVFVAVFVSAVIAITGRTWPGVLGAVLGMTVLGVQFASHLEPRLVLANRLLSIVPGLVLLVIVMALSLRAGPVTYHRIAGAVLSYLLIALWWARLYALAIYLVPGSIGAPGGGGAPIGVDDLLYFSIMTLTTAGYGDLVPQNATTRALASLEAIVGVLFPVVYVSRFVAALQTRG